MIDILVGSDETAFYKQFKTDPRSNGIKTASFLMDDGIAAAIGGQLLHGTVISTGYFKDNPSKGNQQFVNALKKKYGDKAQISGAAAAAWDGVFILAHALKNAKSTSGPDVIAALHERQVIGPARRPRLQEPPLRRADDVRGPGAEGRNGEAGRQGSSGSRRSRPTRPARRLRERTSHKVGGP